MFIMFFMRIYCLRIVLLHFVCLILTIRGKEEEKEEEEEGEEEGDEEKEEREKVYKFELILF